MTDAERLKEIKEWLDTWPLSPGKPQAAIAGRHARAAVVWLVEQVEKAWTELNAVRSEIETVRQQVLHDHVWQYDANAAGSHPILRCKCGLSKSAVGNIVHYRPGGEP